MSDFSVVVSAVDQAVSASRCAEADLTDELRRLRREVDEVLSGSWRGAAATAFDRFWSDWLAGAEELVVGLDRLAQLLVQCGGAYQFRDQTSAHVLQLAAS